MTKSDYFSDLVIDSHVLEGTFASVSFCLHAWFGGVVAFLAIFLLVHQYGKFRVSLAIPSSDILWPIFIAGPGVGGGGGGWGDTCGHYV